MQTHTAKWLKTCVTNWFDPAIAQLNWISCLTVVVASAAWRQSKASDVRYIQLYDNKQILISKHINIPYIVQWVYVRFALVPKAFAWWFNFIVCLISLLVFMLNCNATRTRRHLIHKNHLLDSTIINAFGSFWNLCGSRWIHKALLLTTAYSPIDTWLVPQSNVLCLHSNDSFKTCLNLCCYICIYGSINEKFTICIMSFFFLLALGPKKALECASAL